ncbi:MAG: peptidoglycan-associated lipoprotein Pal, partial [Candidatus Competibacterales bacterium]
GQTTPLDDGDAIYAYGGEVGGGGDGVSGPLQDPAVAAAVAQLGRVIYFEFDSAEVSLEAQPLIERHAALLRDNPQVQVVLEGHADERGTREYNIGLGERRSQAVRRLLTAFGVSPQQLDWVSYGEERPLTFGQDELSYSRNRRVEIVY